MRPLLTLLLVTVSTLLPLQGAAAAVPVPAAKTAPAAEAHESPSDEAAVVVFNREIAVLRAPLFGSPATTRARRTQERILELLDRGGSGVVTMQQEPQGNILLIDGAMALALVPQDADAVGGETLAAATEKARVRLVRLIAETREARDHGQLLRALLRAGIATLVFAVVTGIVLRIRRTLSAWATQLLADHAEAVRVAGAPVLQRSSLRTLAHGFVQIVAWSIVAVLSYEWLAYVLTQFPYTRAWGEALGGYLVGIGKHIGNAILHAIPDLIVAVLIFLIARAVITALRPIFDRIERGHGESNWLQPDTVVPTRRLVNVGIWLFAVVMAYPYIPGADSEAFKGISVLVGLMITLGGSSLFGQAASGLILIYSRTLRVGEYVRVADQEGTVTEMGTFTTKIRTGMGEEVTIPNAVVLGTTTRNYSRTVKGAGYIVDTVATIGYDTPWRQVEAMLVEAARRTEGVLLDPAPLVFQTALSDFYIEYRLVCQAVPSRPLPRAQVLSQLHAHVIDVFNEYGVQIMSPHYLADPPQDKLVPPEKRYAAPARTPPVGEAPR